MFVSHLLYRQSSLHRSASLQSLQFDLSWHMSKGRQLDITFGDTANRSVAGRGYPPSQRCGEYFCLYLACLPVNRSYLLSPQCSPVCELTSVCHRLSSHRRSCLINTVSRRQIVFKLLRFYFLAGYFALISLAPRPCSRSV